MNSKRLHLAGSQMMGWKGKPNPSSYSLCEEGGTVSFHGLYLPFFPLLTDRRQIFFYTEYFVICGVFILSAFVTKCDEKDPYYCFTWNSLVAVCACFLTDFHWNAAWRKQKNSWLSLKSKQYLWDSYCQGWNCENYHLLSGQHIYCHLVLYRIVAATVLRLSV